MYIHSIHEPGEQNVMGGFGLYRHAGRSSFVVIWHYVVNGRNSMSDKKGRDVCVETAVVEWKLYRVGFKKNHKNPSQYAWLIFGRRTAIFSMSHSRHCCVKTVGPVGDLHLITTLVVIR